MSAPSSPLHVVIIGAGPAGLATAFCLSRRKIGYTLLERGTNVVAALRKVDPDMTLLSPSRLSRLPYMAHDAKEPAYMTFREMVEALERYQEQHDIEVVTDARVTSVERNGSGFVVAFRDAKGESHTVKGSHVVNATGIISAPRLPDNFDPDRCSFQWLHSLDTRASDLAAARRLLVVGGGASATEVIERWLDVRQPDDHAWLSLRSPLIAVPHWIFGIDVHYLVWLPEQAPASLVGWRAGRLHEPMTGRDAVRAIGRGIITRAPAVSAYEGKGVTFSDGSRLEPDLVVFATGFRYSTEHLDDLIDFDPDGRPLVRNCESARTPGLFLMGFRFGRTFASPYIRGIARDAEYLARRIAKNGEWRMENGEWRIEGEE
jgi:putative flavoprotein involved in K+ transport